MKVGDYVRTKQGIEKIKVVEENFMGDENCIFYATDNKEWNGAYNGKYNGFTNRNRTIIKSSPNIIDLIEVGDYVNGSKVVDISIIGKDKEKWVWVEQMEDTDNKYGDDYVGYNNNQIKSIVTHEQFSQMEYRIGE